MAAYILARMERKQGFFSTLKEEVVHGFSLARSRAKSPGRSTSPMSSLFKRKKVSTSNPEQLIARSGSLRPVGKTLTPLMEGPDPDGGEIGGSMVAIVGGVVATTDGGGDQW
ncbi:hypothetical protein ACS0TY_035324 [Phlomoides rotata]